MNIKDKKNFSMSIVLLGDFQPGMFQPLWFLDNGVITKAEYEAIIKNTGKTFVVNNAITSFETDIISFSVGQKRFQFLGKKEPFEKVIDSFKKVFDSLSTIPINAYGINFFFHLAVDNYKEMKTIGTLLAPRKYWESLYDTETQEDGLISMTMRKTTEYGCLNISIESSNAIKPGIFLNFNFHHSKKESSFVVGEIEEKLENQYKEYNSQVTKISDNIFEKINEYK